MVATGDSAPLTDEEREQLRQRLLQRRQELVHQQQQVRQLQGKALEAVNEGIFGPGVVSGGAPAGDDADVGKVCRNALQS